MVDVVLVRNHDVLVEFNEGRVLPLAAIDNIFDFVAQINHLLVLVDMLLLLWNVLKFVLLDLNCPEVKVVQS